MNIAIIIPALNEAQSLPRLLAAIAEVSTDLGHAQIIVVDNGSTDETAEVAREGGAQVIDEPRRGYGFACAAGVREIHSADAVLFVDADFSFDPSEMSVLLEPIRAGTADLVLGSRFLSGNEANMPPHQRFGNWLAANIIRIFYGQKVTDLGPYRAIRRDLLDQLRMQEMNYGWQTEMIVKAARTGAEIAERPVGYSPRFAGKSKVSGTIRGSALAAYGILRTTMKYLRWHGKVP
jgi:glycosyltransferase involved in cell wall biosynthesis